MKAASLSGWVSFKKCDLNREEIPTPCVKISLLFCFEEKLILLTGNNQKSKQEKATKEAT